MGQIIRLDAKLSNMIAAGEVVERIGNVVKELVENAIDAQSSKIDVYLEESGMRLIRVVDNGVGMDESDALLAFERHATSKIKNEYDLFHIRSLGFRGEAIPSIASVSRVELETSTGDSEGVRVVYEDGEFLEKSMGPWRKGTIVSVSRLFYHTPARYKYLKSPQTELANIVELMDKFALSHPEISFSLHHNGKLTFQTSGNGNTLDVLAKVYGLEVAKSMRRFSAKNRDYEISGFVSNPIQNRSNKNYLNFYVNHRQIRSTKLQKAVIDAYGQLIPIGRYPIVLVNISVDASLVDVNVHPTKQQVRFSEEDSLISLIEKTVRNKLELVEVIQPIKPQVKSQPDMIQERFELPVAESQASSEQTTQETFHVEEEIQPTIKRIPAMEYIGQYHGTFLLFQNKEGLYMMDQHAAAERIRYERYLDRMSRPSTGSYDLLVPMIIELSASYVIEIDRKIEAISRFGIELVKENESTYQIKKIPSWFPRGYEIAYTESVLMTFVEEKSVEVSDLRDELAKLLSCKHSLKANAFVTKMEAEQLLSDLNRCLNPYTCPHGRPILLFMNETEIERWFHRIQS